MTADNPSPFVPKLRFPEFRDDPTWSAPQFADLYGFKRTNTLSRDKLNYETGTIRNIHYGDIHTKFKPLFRVGEEYVPYVNPDASANGFDDDAFCEEGDIVLADASEDLDDVGKAIEVVSLDRERVVAGTHTILATRRGSVPVVGFGGQLFQSAAVRAGIKKEAQGAKVYGISAKRISVVLVPVPPTVAEQQKIADCLGSLDDLIAAEGRKLEALRQHKQGLMQQLFPRSGETVPQLRFPEFADAPHWQTSTFGERCESFSGSTPDTSNSAYYGGTISFIRSAEIGRDETEIFLTEEGLANSAAKMVKRGDLLVALYGANSGDTALARIDGAINQAIMCLRSHDSAPYLYHYLTARKNWIIATYMQGGQGNLSGQIVLSVPLCVPHRDEQEKVADCLSTLDARIEEQAQRIDALRRHRQGLLQQLFPPPEGP